MKKRMLRNLSIFPMFFLLVGCGGDKGGEDAAEDLGADPDATDGDAATDPGVDDPAGEDAALDDAAEGDVQPDADVPAEVSDPPSEEIPGPPVDCGGTECSSAQECCFTMDPPWLECVNAGTCEGDVMTCDEKADCPGVSYDCCYLWDDSRIECSEICGGGQLVCGSDDDCKLDMPFCCPDYAGLMHMCKERWTESCML